LLLQSPSCPSPDLSAAHSLEAVDDASDNNDEEKEHFSTTTFTPAPHRCDFNSSDFEDDKFDNDLH
jgi:hypothetical protein